MSIPIEDKLPSEVLDEIVVSDQSHVLGYFEDNDYTEEDVANFIKQCQSFDMIRACNLYTNSISRNRILSRVYKEIKEYPTEYKNFDSLSKEERDHYAKKGLQLMAEGKLALILLAGGQASRLSPNSIKGDYDIGLPSHKSIFERIFQAIQHIQNLVEKETKTKIQLSIYIMTSEFNNQAIEEYPSQITFFTQGSLPCVDQNGHFIMRKKHQIALAPNGSGGLYYALQKHQIITQLQQKGIQFIQCFGIDNIMEIPADPLFLGYASEQTSEICIKCVEKCCPEEQLSMLVEYSKKPFLALCSEMNYRQICKRDTEGELVYRYGYIFDSILTVDFLSHQCMEMGLPAYCHIVKKAIPYYDPILYRTINPITPNAFKMEYYFSDVFPFAHSIHVAVVPREEYIPIKNPPGKPIASPEKAVEELSNTQLSYLEKHHIQVEKPSEIHSENQVEISPLVSIRDEGIHWFEDLTLSLPCCIYDHSEWDLSKYEYTKVNEHVACLSQKVNNRTIYILL